LRAQVENLGSFGASAIVSFTVFVKLSLLMMCPTRMSNALKVIRKHVIDETGQKYAGGNADCFGPVAVTTVRPEKTHISFSTGN